MKRILVLDTGGTSSQVRNERGNLEPALQKPKKTLGELAAIANIFYEDIDNIDSSNMEASQDWIRTAADPPLYTRRGIAAKLYDERDWYDAFIIVHGTDTMAETAAYLTYCLRNFGKPIILTGSKLPADDPASDFYSNLSLAVKSALLPLGEVAIASGDKLWRGTRAIKVGVEGAFNSFGVDPIGKAHGRYVRLASHAIPPSHESPTFFGLFNPKVFHYMHISGSVVDDDLAAIAESETIEAILLGSFGSGNNPQRLIPFIERAYKHDKPVIVYTSCLEGVANLGAYALGMAAYDAGARSALDMTFQALGQKVMYALAVAKHEGYSRNPTLSDRVMQIITTPMHGDIVGAQG